MYDPKLQKLKAYEEAIPDVLKKLDEIKKNMLRVGIEYSEEKFEIAGCIGHIKGLFMGIEEFFKGFEDET